MRGVGSRQLPSQCWRVCNLKKTARYDRIEPQPESMELKDRSCLCLKKHQGGLFQVTFRLFLPSTLLRGFVRIAQRMLLLAALKVQRGTWTDCVIARFVPSLGHAGQLVLMAWGGKVNPSNSRFRPASCRRRNRL